MCVRIRSTLITKNVDKQIDGHAIISVDSKSIEMLNNL